MNQSDREILLKDLSARLPYGVLIHCFTLDTDERLFGINLLNVETEYTEASPIISVDEEGQEGCYSLDEIKPYLRPLSSMTDKEKEEYLGTMVELPNEEYLIRTLRIIDFCNSHHLDYRGLIPKGLALEAPNDMYKFE